MTRQARRQVELERRRAHKRSERGYRPNWFVRLLRRYDNWHYGRGGWWKTSAALALFAAIVLLVSQFRR